MEQNPPADQTVKYGRRIYLIISGGEQVYEGQVVGEHCRDNDLPVNVCMEKKLTNMRNANAEKSIILKPPRQLTLERLAKARRIGELAERPERVAELPPDRVHGALQRKRQKAEPPGRCSGLEPTARLVDLRDAGHRRR